jgi:hypothetical protein
MDQAPLNFEHYVQHHMDWSFRTFGPGRNDEGLRKHIAKELKEIEADPTDLLEWIDIIILAIDGAWRAGYTAEQVADALAKKQLVNLNRQWPAKVEGQAIEHDRTAEYFACTYSPGRKCKWAIPGDCAIPAHLAAECPLNDPEDIKACQDMQKGADRVSGT